MLPLRLTMAPQWLSLKRLPAALTPNQPDLVVDDGTRVMPWACTAAQISASLMRCRILVLL
jgi:hypothetical protein